VCRRFQPLPADRWDWLLTLVVQLEQSVVCIRVWVSKLYRTKWTVHGSPRNFWDKLIRLQNAKTFIVTGGNTTAGMTHSGWKADLNWKLWIVNKWQLAEKHEPNQYYDQRLCCSMLAWLYSKIFLIIACTYCTFVLFVFHPFCLGYCETVSVCV